MPHPTSRFPVLPLQIGLITLSALLAACGAAPSAPPAAQEAPQANFSDTLPDDPPEQITPSEDFEDQGEQSESVEAQALPGDGLRVTRSSASGANGQNKTSQKAWDDRLNTWWGANGIGAWLRLDLGSQKNVDAVSISFFRGDRRRATFDVELSRDGRTWNKVLSGVKSSGRSKNLERFNLSNQAARYVRVVNRGNTENSAIGLNEVVVHGSGGSGDGPGGTTVSGRKYYLDCWSGNDSDSGTSSDKAWRSVSKANRANLRPGDGLFLRRGCTWNGPLNLKWSGTSSTPITVDAYGNGERPLLRNGRPGAVSISGRYLIVQNLQATADKPRTSSRARRCRSTPLGWTAGFAFTGGASNNTLRSAKAYGLTAGVHLAGGSSRNKVLNNELVNNTVMSNNTPGKKDDDSGAWGILLNGDHNEVAFNSFSGNTACSEDYGVEGASIELYKASHNYIHHNTSINDTTFTELGGSGGDRSEYNTYAYNLYAPVDTGGELLVVRGYKSKWGANPGTKFYNNTAYKVSVGVSCSHGCDRSILSARNNIIWLRSDADKAALWADGPIDEGNNVYWKDNGKPLPVIQGGSISASSKVANPRFENAARRNFRLQGGSPAVNAGTLSPIAALNIATDLAGNRTPVGTVDIGAFERQ